MPSPTVPASAVHAAAWQLLADAAPSSSPAPAQPQRAAAAADDQDVAEEPSSSGVLFSGPTVDWPLPAGLDLAHVNVVLSGGTSGVGLEAAKASRSKGGLWFGRGAAP